MLKASKCNILVDDGIYLTIYNVMSGYVARFTEEARIDVQKALVENSNNRECQNFLLKKGYLVSDDINEDERINRIKYNLIENKDMLFLTILPTEQCNFRCKYCPEITDSIYMGEKTEEVIISFLEKVLSNFKKLVIAWFGGEPLLVADFIQSISARIKELCKKNNVLFSATITTNGYFLNANMFQKMLACNIVNYCITLDGYAYTHDLQRPLKSGMPTWNHIVNNLIDIRDNVSSRLFNIIIRTNVTTTICDDYLDYFEFLKKEFNDDRRFGFMWRKAEDWGNIEEKDKELIGKNSDFIDFMRKVKNYGLRDSLTSRSLKPIDRICTTTTKNALVIYPDGRISKCSRDIHPEVTTIGYLNELLDKADFLLSQSLTSMYGTNCSSCQRYYNCLGLGCPLENDECNLDSQYVRNLLESIQDTDLENGIIKKFEGCDYE